MNIYMSGYFNRNFGDDLMMRIAAYQLSEHKFYVNLPRGELFLPFESTPNILRYNPDDDIKFDMSLYVTGSGFIVGGLISMIYFVLDEVGRRKKFKHTTTAAVSCNIGPFNNFLSKRLEIWKLRSFDFVSVRDKASYDFVRKYAPRTEVRIFPDIVFSMPEEWIPDVETEDCLGISVYRNGEADNLEYYRAIAETADNYIDRTGKKVLLFAFSIELENDLCAAHTVLSMMRRCDKAEIIAHNDDGENILRNIKRCSKIITGRLHMAIAAVRMGIAFVPVSYSPKIVNVLRDMGYTGEIFDRNAIDPKRLTEAVMSAQVLEVRDEFFKSARGHSDCIRKMLT